MERLKELRIKRKLLQKDVAEALQVSRTTYVKYENGNSEPSQKILVKLATFFNVTTDYLLKKTNYPTNSKQGVKIPIFGDVAAGIPISAIEDIVDYEEITEELANSGEYFGLVIKGNSMEPRMTTGDVVIVKSQSTIENGEIAIVMVDGETATCKKIKKTPDGIILLSLNPAFEPIFFTNKEIEQLPVRILGKVIELRAKF